MTEQQDIEARKAINDMIANQTVLNNELLTIKTQLVEIQAKMTVPPQPPTPPTPPPAPVPPTPPAPPAPTEPQTPPATPPTTPPTTPPK